MSSPPLIAVSSPPTGGIVDFDLVVDAGRTLLVGSPDRDYLACAWDPVSDQWTEYRLDNVGDAGDFTDLTSMAAAVVDGRIVIGGGGDHQGFAMWDLESGRLTSSAWTGGVWSAARAELDGRRLFVVGGSSNTNVELWDPSLSEPPDEDSLGSGTHPLDGMVEVGELCASSGASSAVAAGTLDGRGVLVANTRADETVVWDIEEDCALTEFGHLDRMCTDFALTTVDGHARVVAANTRELRLGDAVTGEWEEPLPVPGGKIACLDAGTVRGRPVAAAGFADGMVCVWDLSQGRLLGGPFGERENRISPADNRVHEIRIADLDGRPVIITAQNDDAVRVWDLSDEW